VAPQCEHARVMGIEVSILPPARARNGSMLGTGYDIERHEVSTQGGNVVAPGKA
jgi:hypothetical protein